MSRSNQNLSCFKFTIFVYLCLTPSVIPQEWQRKYQPSFELIKRSRPSQFWSFMVLGGLVLFCCVKESKILINWTENNPLKKAHNIVLPHSNSWFYFEAACSWAGSSTDDAKRKLTQREGNRKSITLLTHHSCFQQPSCYWAVFWLIFVWYFHLFILTFFPKVLSCTPERAYF